MSNMIVILTFLRGDNVNRNNDSVNMIANTTLPDMTLFFMINNVSIASLDS